MHGAAFFDVDRTLLAGASGLHLAPALRKHGLLSVRQLANTLLVQLTFSRRGTNDDQLDRYTEAVKDLMAGWDHETLVKVVDEELDDRIRPMVFREALERIEMHKRQGIPVYAVSATIEEIVHPLADRLGLDGAIGSRMETKDGRFTGIILENNHGEEKARRVREFAAEHNIDLNESYAYSDSITDQSFLRLVGRPYAVNPDKELKKLAKQEGWGLLSFTTRTQLPSLKKRTLKIGFIALIAGLGILSFSKRKRTAKL